jgi:hypothetical protein
MVLSAKYLYILRYGSDLNKNNSNEKCLNIGHYPELISSPIKRLDLLIEMQYLYGVKKPLRECPNISFHYNNKSIIKVLGIIYNKLVY